MMDKLEFAEALGFDTFEELMEASDTVIRESDIGWCVTQLPNGRWVVWDNVELSLDWVEYFDTREEAIEFQKSLNVFARILIGWERAQGDMMEE